MKHVYDILDTLRDALRAEHAVNTVTFGQLSDINLDKTTIFPLAHIILKDTSHRGNILDFNIQILLSDVVDVSNDGSTDDDFYGNDNLQDVLNTQFEVGNKIVTLMQRGDLFSNLYQIDGTPVLRPFIERFNNVLAGYELDVSISVQNDIEVCSDGSSSGGGDNGGITSAPVISDIGLQYVQLDVPYVFQLSATPTADSWSAFGLVNGMILNETIEGRITGTVTGAERLESVSFTATNSFGSNSKTVFFQMTTQSANEFLAPFNVRAEDINATNFKLLWDYRDYNGTVTEVHIFKDDVLRTTLINSGGSKVTSFLIQNLTSQTTSAYKVRFKNSDNELSPFSDIINVTTV